MENLSIAVPEDLVERLGKLRTKSGMSHTFSTILKYYLAHEGKVTKDPGYDEPVQKNIWLDNSTWESLCKLREDKDKEHTFNDMVKFYVDSRKVIKDNPDDPVVVQNIRLKKSTHDKFLALQTKWKHTQITYDDIVQYYLDDNKSPPHEGQRRVRTWMDNDVREKLTVQQRLMPDSHNINDIVKRYLNARAEHPCVSTAETIDLSVVVKTKDYKKLLSLRDREGQEGNDFAAILSAFVYQKCIDHVVWKPVSRPLHEKIEALRLDSGNIHSYDKIVGFYLEAHKAAAGETIHNSGCIGLGIALREEEWRKLEALRAESGEVHNFTDIVKAYLAKMPHGDGQYISFFLEKDFYKKLKDIAGSDAVWLTAKNALFKFVQTYSGAHTINFDLSTEDYGKLQAAAMELDQNPILTVRNLVYDFIHHGCKTKRPTPFGEPVFEELTKPAVTLEDLGLTTQLHPNLFRKNGKPIRTWREIIRWFIWPC